MMLLRMKKQSCDACDGCTCDAALPGKLPAPDNQRIARMPCLLCPLLLLPPHMWVTHCPNSRQSSLRQVTTLSTAAQAADASCAERQDAASVH